jgi:hypothetical protein
MASNLREGDQPHQRQHPRDKKQENKPPKKWVKKSARGNVSAGIVARGTLASLEEAQGEVDALREKLEEKHSEGEAASSSSSGGGESGGPSEPDGKEEKEKDYKAVKGEYFDYGDFGGDMKVFRKATTKEQWTSSVAKYTIPGLFGCTVGLMAGSVTGSRVVGVLSGILGFAYAFKKYPRVVQRAHKIATAPLPPPVLRSVRYYLACSDAMPTFLKPEVSFMSHAAMGLGVLMSTFRKGVIQAGHLQDLGLLKVAAPGGDLRAVVYRENKKCIEDVQLRVKQYHDYATGTMRTLLECPQMAAHLMAALSACESAKSLVMSADMVARNTLLNVPSAFNYAVQEGSSVVASLRSEHVKLRRMFLPGVTDFPQGTATATSMATVTALLTAAVPPGASSTALRWCGSATSVCSRLAAMCRGAWDRTGVG